MKIIFITREGKDSPGARIRCYQTASIFNSLGVSAEVFSMADNLNMPEGKSEHTLTAINKISANFKTFIHLIKSTGQKIIILNRINYHALAPLFFCLITRTKLVLDLDDWEINEHLPGGVKKYIKSFALSLTVIAAKKSILCICASSYLYRFIKQINKNTIKIPSCVLPLCSENKEKPISSETINFCWIGTVHKKTNVSELEDLISIFNDIYKTNPNVRFNIIATGKLIAEVTRITAPYKHISLHKDLTPAETSASLTKNDIGLLPLFAKSKFNICKSPVKLFEYMDAELAVIAIRNQETKTIISHKKSGLLAKNKDECLSYMNLLVNDSLLRQTLAKEGKKTMTDKFNPIIYTKHLKEKLQIT